MTFWNKIYYSDSSSNFCAMGMTDFCSELVNLPHVHKFFSYLSLKGSSILYFAVVRVCLHKTHIEICFNVSKIISLPQPCCLIDTGFQATFHHQESHQVLVDSEMRIENAFQKVCLS